MTLKTDDEYLIKNIAHHRLSLKTLATFACQRYSLTHTIPETLQAAVWEADELQRLYAWAQSIKIVYPKTILLTSYGYPGYQELWCVLKFQGKLDGNYDIKKGIFQILNMHFLEKGFQPGYIYQIHIVYEFIQDERTIYPLREVAYLSIDRATEEPLWDVLDQQLDKCIANVANTIRILCDRAWVVMCHREAAAAAASSTT